ncbi:ATP-dependent DNA helicase [Candidatus Woesearchaeota archaeon]|nr:ATP-dependent DNA helicase [Candidatus Woesearchaeota archaeon]
MSASTDDVLFPYPSVRQAQDTLLHAVRDTLASGGELIAHAPTGLGKTAAAIGPAVARAIADDLTVFFLTSRHTQHEIAVETLREISRRYRLPIVVSDIIGKRWMCSQEGIERLYANEFAEYCKAVREDYTCEFYQRTRKRDGKSTPEAQALVAELAKEIVGVEDLTRRCRAQGFCPYEVAMLVAAKARVVIADYYSVFHPRIRESFFSRCDKELPRSVVIVDEAHNLPGRIRDLATARLSSVMLRRAVQEAKRYGHAEAVAGLALVQDALLELSEGLAMGKERLVSREGFLEPLGGTDGAAALADSFAEIGDEVRKGRRSSSIGSVGEFLSCWPGPDEGFARILSLQESKREQLLALSYRCLDPSVVAQAVIAEARATVIMSGTLTPPEMYRDLLGFPESTALLQLESPFPHANRLNLIVPKTTTKFSLRSEMQYKRMAGVVQELIEAVPGNIALFFPSYNLRDTVVSFLPATIRDQLVVERRDMTSQEKAGLLRTFKAGSTRGVALAACISGSFAEGIDLPGDLLKAVVVVGLPLQQPDLETESLIRYFDRKFGKGWDYGYMFPAFNKALQGAGRCIRSETDRGVIVFLDERYVWPNYFRCFPFDWQLEISTEYVLRIARFFASQ